MARVGRLTTLTTIRALEYFFEDLADAEDFLYIMNYPHQLIRLWKFYYYGETGNLIRDLESYEAAICLRWKDFEGTAHLRVTDADRDTITEEEKARCDTLLTKLVADTIKYIEDRSGNRPTSLTERLKHLAELDGFSWSDGRLVPVDSGPVSLPQKQDLIEQLVNSLPLQNGEVILQHLSDSAKRYEDQNWKDSAAQSRHFFEQVLRDICNGTHRQRTGSDHPRYQTAAAVRQYLKEEGFFTPDEFDGVEGVYSFLSGTGGHPGLAYQEVALLSRHLALGLVHFLLLKFQDWVNNNCQSFSRP